MSKTPSRLIAFINSLLCAVSAHGWSGPVNDGASIAAPEPALGSFQLTYRGIGPVKIGMTLAQLRKMGYQLSRQDNTSTDAQMGVTNCVNAQFFTSRVTLSFFRTT